MIVMHDGNCKPFIIERLPGEMVNRSAWEVKRGQVGEPRLPEQPIVGWRYAAVYKVGNEIFYLGGFGTHPESVFGDQVATLPTAYCDTSVAAGTPAAADTDPYPHAAPGEWCQCGYRIVHDLHDLAKYMEFLEDPIPVEGMDPPALIAVPVVGGGLSTAAIFDTYEDPGLCVRVQHVALEGFCLVDSGDRDAGTALAKLGLRVTTVDGLDQMHDPHKCNERQEKYEVWKVAINARPTPGRLSFSEDHMLTFEPAENNTEGDN